MGERKKRAVHKGGKPVASLADRMAAGETKRIILDLAHPSGRATILERLEAGTTASDLARWIVESWAPFWQSVTDAPAGADTIADVLKFWKWWPAIFHAVGSAGFSEPTVNGLPDRLFTWQQRAGELLALAAKRCGMDWQCIRASARLCNTVALKLWLQAEAPVDLWGGWPDCLYKSPKGFRMPAKDAEAIDSAEAVMDMLVPSLRELEAEEAGCMLEAKAACSDREPVPEELEGNSDCWALLAILDGIYPEGRSLRCLQSQHKPGNKELSYNTIRAKAEVLRRHGLTKQAEGNGGQVITPKGRRYHERYGFQHGAAGSP